MPKLVCYFGGWFENDVEKINLTDPHSMVTKTAAEWLADKGNIDGLILDSFNDANAEASDGEFTELDLKIEEDACIS